MLKGIANIVLVSLLEIVCYNSSIFLLWEIGLVFHEPISKGIFWGLSIMYSVYVFATLVLIKNTFEEIFKTNRIILSLVAMVVFSALVQEFKTIPLRTLLLIASAILALSVKLIFDYKTNQRSKIKNLKPQIKCS